MKARLSKRLEDNEAKRKAKEAGIAAKNQGFEPLTEYFDRPHDFFVDVLGHRRDWWWNKPQEILERLLEAQEVYCRASHGVSKTYSAAAIAEWWFSARGHPVITSAPTRYQVRTLLWQQIQANRMMAQRPLPGTLLPGLLEVRVPGKPKWIFRGFSTDQPEKAQGVHLDNLLIILDEAAGCPDWLSTAIKGWMTNPGVKLLCIGNPNKRRNFFRAAFFERLGAEGLATIHIDATVHSPNVLAGEMVIPGLATREWVEDRRDEWGEDSDEFQMKVRGNFPSDSEEKAIPMEWIDLAFALGERHAAEEAEFYARWDPDSDEPNPWRIVKAALDVARTGNDRCAQVYLAGPRIKIARYWHEPDTMATAKYAARWIYDCAGLPLDLEELDELQLARRLGRRPEHFIVDVNAVGGGVYDRLREILRETPEQIAPTQIVGLDWGASPDDKTRSVEVVDELYQRLRHRFDPATPERERLSLPTATELARVGLTKEVLAAQLNARLFDYDDKNRFRVESKKKLAKRLRELGGAKSPDVGDAIVALTYRPKRVRMAMV